MTWVWVGTVVQLWGFRVDFAEGMVCPQFPGENVSVRIPRHGRECTANVLDVEKELLRDDDYLLLLPHCACHEATLPD